MIQPAYLGIDPGLSGGIALIHPDGVITHRMPVMDGIDARTLHGVLREWSERWNLATAVERVHSMPRQGVSSTFTFGLGTGRIQGVLSSLGLEYLNPLPPKWKKLVLSQKFLHDKDGAVAFCRETYPSAELIPPGCRVPHDGIADALCIAHYAKLTSGH